MSAALAIFFIKFLTPAFCEFMFCSVTATSAFIEPGPRDPDGPAEPCAAEARQARQLGVLQELTEIGMQMARALRDEALAPIEAPAEAPPQPAPRARFGGKDLGLQFSRIAKAVRQTVALETRVAEGIETARREHEQRRVGAARMAFDDHQDDIRGFVVQAIESEAERRELPESEVERLTDELDERLEDGCYDDALADGPIAELVGRICFDLGLTPDWRIWDEDWAVQYIKDHTPDDIGAERWARDYPPEGGGADPPDDPEPESG